VGFVSNHRMRYLRRKPGFTLAELLIALAILGVIATFTIPKVLQSQQNGKYKAIGKEFAGTMAQAFQKYRLQNGDNPTMQAQDITPYLNYVKVVTDSSLQADGAPWDGGWTATCDGTQICLKMHSGAILYYWPADSFCSTQPTAIVFRLDPDGQADGRNLGLDIYLYSNGKVRTDSTIDIPTYHGSGSSTCSGTYNATGSDPPWFNWN